MRVVALAITVTVAAGTAATLLLTQAPPAAAVSTPGADLAALRARVARLSAGLSALEAEYGQRVAPIERALRGLGAPADRARVLSVAVAREAARTGVDPWMLVGIMLTENPWFDPRATSPAGAVGIMQVMPFHEGGWPCAGALTDPAASVCYGAQIFAHYRAAAPSLTRALLRYNGCVRGTRTPDCHEYPRWVMERAFRAREIARR